jgi:3-oxoadipate enol-lactonase
MKSPIFAVLLLVTLSTSTAEAQSSPKVDTASPVAPSGLAKVNGETIYYEVEGKGTPLVLIHGWSLNLRMWDQQTSELKRRFKVIRYDRRGFGRSSGNEDPTWDAADLDALLDYLGVKAAHLLGNSQGGRVALQFAHAYPDRALSLTLHGASAPEAFGLQWTGPDRPRFEEWAKMTHEHGLDPFRRAWAAHPLMAIPPGHQDARARLEKLINAYRGGRFDPVQPSGPIPGVTMDDVRGIRVPALVIIGESETPFLQLVSRALAYYIPDARLSVIRGGGHMINLIEPTRYNAAVTGFLEGVEARK